MYNENVNVLTFICLLLKMRFLHLDVLMVDGYGMEMVNEMINIIDLKKQIVLFNLLILYKNKKTKIDDLYNYRMNIGTWCYCKKC